MNEDLMRRFHEFINHDSKVGGHKVVHEVRQYVEELKAEIVELKQKLNHESYLHDVHKRDSKKEIESLQQQLKEARKEAFNAGRRDKKGCVVQIDYKDGGFEFPRLEDFLATKEDAQQTSDKEPTK